MGYNWTQFIQFTLFPPRCVICGTSFRPPPARDLCNACHADLPWIAKSCTRCGLPIPESAPPGTLCGQCVKKAPPFDRCIAPYTYEPPIRDLVTRLKYGGRLANARLLGDLLAEYLVASTATLPDVMLPVPLHPSRIRERGFNQALEIGRTLSRRLRIPLDRYSLRRVRAGAAQAGLDRRQRRANVRGAFAVKPGFQAGHVAIIDDVVTTGQTAIEVARTLRQAGIGEISVWAIARTPDS